MQKIQNKKNRVREYGIVLVTLLAVYGVVCAMTQMFPWQHGSAMYNSYSLQAAAWRSGRLDLGRNYSYLELAIYGGKYYVSFPPFPSFIFYVLGMMFGDFSFDGYVAFASILVGAFYVMRILYAMDRKHVPFWTLFLMVGSNLIFVSCNGWVWFIAQNLSFTLSIMAIYYAMMARGGESFFFWACAVGCRPFQIVYFPMLAYIVYKKLKEQNPGKSFLELVLKKLYWAVPTLIIAGVYMWLNYARFGSITEFGHNYLPEFMESVDGQFDLSYIGTNWWSMVRLAEYNGSGFQYCRFNGMALWISMPIYITYVWYLIYHARKHTLRDMGLVVMQIVIMVIHVLLILSHKTLGGWQFGNRYFIDLLPFVFYTFLHATPADDDPLYRYQKYLFAFGLVVNMAGTVATYNNFI